MHVREGAAELLAELLDIMAARERQARNQPYLTRLVEHSFQGLKTNQVEIIHGSLLTYRELLLHAGMVGATVTHPYPYLISTYRP